MADRKQVNLDNLGKVDPTPSIQAVGGTNQVAVPTVLKDNNYLRISRSLAQFSNILGQTSNINMQLGKDAAEKLSADEINDIIEGKVPAPSGGALGKLGFQKAFHQIAAKRWFDTTGVKKYADLENRLDAKMDEFIQNSTPIEQVQAYVQGEVQALEGEIGEYFDGNSFGSRVKNLIGGELSTRVLAGATKGYEKKQLAYMRAAKLESLSPQFADAVLGNSGEEISDFVKRADTNELEGFSNAEKADYWKKSLTDVMGILVANAQVEGDTTLADAQIEEISGIKGKNGALIFGSTANRATLARAGSHLNRIDTEDVVMKRSELESNFKGAVSNAYNTFKRFTDRGDEIVKGTTPYMDLENALDVLNIDGGLGDDEEMAAVAEQIAASDKPQEALGNYLTQVVSERKDNPDIRISSLIRSTQDDLITRRIAINQATQFSDLGYSSEALKDANDKALLYFLDNPKEDAEAYVATTELPGNVKPTKIMQRAHNEAHKFDEILPKEADIENILKAAYDPLPKNKKLKALFGSSRAGASKVDPLISSQLLRNQAKDQAVLLKKRLLETARNEFSGGEGKIKEGAEEDLQKLMREKAANMAKIYAMELEALAIRLDQFEEVKDLDDKVQIMELPPEQRTKLIEDNRKKKIGDKDKTSAFYTDKINWFGVFGVDADVNNELQEYPTLNREFAETLIGDEFTPDVGGRINKQRAKIKVDYEKARAEENTTALRLLQDMYGYEGINFNNQKILDDLDESERDWTDVKLFATPQELNNAASAFLNLFNKIEETEGATDLTTDEEKVLDYAVRLGIFSEQIEDAYPYLTEFFKAQKQFLPSIK